MRNILFLLLIACCFFAGAQPSQSNPLQQKSLVLRRLLEQNHYLPLHWDDSASARLYDRWMELLDEEKLLFTNLEISPIVSYRTRLDEELMGKEWAFFNKTIQVYSRGLLRADSFIKQILARPLDFTKADDLNWPLANYPGNDTELYLTWQKYLKWKVLRAVSDMVMDTGTINISNTHQPANFPLLEVKARAQVQKQESGWIRNKLSALAQPGKEMEDNYLSAISWCYDPHTTYMSADTKTDVESELSGLEFAPGFEWMKMIKVNG
ncbi:MAG: hypothetical protein WKI04_02895 [Ferruginibacter sp.]